MAISKVERDVTVVMSVFNNGDFTKASVASVRRFYPLLRFILADGGSNDNEYAFLKTLFCDVLQLVGGTTEQVRNAAASLVRTPFILFMDNDVKMIRGDAIDILLREMKPLTGEVAPYGIKVIDWKKRKAFVGTKFTASMDIDGAPSYFTLFRTEAFRAVGGFPYEFFYPGTPRRFRPLELPRGCGGDFTISTKLWAKGWLCVTAAEEVPVLHWVGAKNALHSSMDFEAWAAKHFHHTRCNPLNAWTEALS